MLRTSKCCTVLLVIAFALSGGATAPAGSGTGTVSIIVSNYCSWIATSDAAWLTAGTGGSGVGTGTATYSVAANTGSSSRTATLSLGGKQFLVTQASTGTASCSTMGDTPLTVVNGQLVVNESLGLTPAIHDVNQDGAVNVTDVQRMLNAVLNLGC